LAIQLRLGARGGYCFFSEKHLYVIEGIGVDGMHIDCVCAVLLRFCYVFCAVRITKGSAALRRFLQGLFRMVFAAAFPIVRFWGVILCKWSGVVIPILSPKARKGGAPVISLMQESTSCKNRRIWESLFEIFL
jgi:hypothetical protein